MPSPCPCRGCKAAYEAGLTDQQWAVHAYEQGREHGYKHGYDEGYKDGYEFGITRLEEVRNEAYREGYNAHARSRAYAEAVYGPYTKREDA